MLASCWHSLSGINPEQTRTWPPVETGDPISRRLRLSVQMWVNSVFEVLCIIATDYIDWAVGLADWLTAVSKSRPELSVSLYPTTAYFRCAKRRPANTQSTLLKTDTRATTGGATLLIDALNRPIEWRHDSRSRDIEPASVTWWRHVVNLFPILTVRRAERPATRYSKGRLKYIIVSVAA